ncbi:MAG: DUF72 domain-containing protein [Chloroflexi bacterium]|nr:DUF72 domain-containing protein [Chloroflexota bacterium]
MGRILVGISSWGDPALVASGSFYTAGVTAPGDMLRSYAAEFPVAELDSTFYTFPSEKAMTLWLDNTPPGFVFNAKAFRLFTGHPTPYNAFPRGVRAEFGEDIPKNGNIYLQKLRGDVVDRVWRLFSKALGPLRQAGKLGVVLFQFPPWFRHSEANRRFLEECASRTPRCQIAVEFRASGWLDGENADSTLGLLRRLKMALVCVDEPQGLKSSVPPVAEVTAPVAVVRFHGRNSEQWEAGASPEEKFDYLYNEEELRQWVPGIRQMAAKVRELHVIFKNKGEDHSIRNARQMVRLLGEN